MCRFVYVVYVVCYKYMHKLLFYILFFSSRVDLCPSLETLISRPARVGLDPCASALLRHSHDSYDEVAQEVLAESVITGGDDFKQAAITFFDNKFGSLVPLKAQFFVQ